ncbi:MAG: 4'-phosphopantetheinyl transferase superfamily protein [Chloroflexi bacterium]|nr:4'-phosphopantetheinyl transferase superfamily protein [Chloroflexota bacterium]
MEGLAVRTGVDLVDLRQFESALSRGGEALRRRLFHPSEEAGADVERLAAVFAAKEAAFKALSLPPGDWHAVEVRHTPEGRPYLAFAPEFDTARVLSCDLSVSHNGGFVVASVVALLRA